MPISINNQLVQIGLRIKYLRKQKKLTQTKLAELVNVDVKTIKRIEAGKSNTGLIPFIEILQVLQENVTEVFPQGSFKKEGKLKKNIIIAWWSGGVTSAVACKWALETYKNVEVVFIDTNNEDTDTYRFLKDCEKWYGITIKRITNNKYISIEEVWDKYSSLNTANGAICSSELKRDVRVKYQNLGKHYAQVFGFDASEKERQRNMKLNYPEINNIAPLIEHGLTKQDCIKIIKEANIEVPNMYKRGYSNNNCFKTGCIQGGVGYWQKIQRESPEKFEAMAEREHRYTRLKKKPITVLRIKKDGIMHPCFLKPLKGFKYHIGIAKGREPKALVECNGFCHTKLEEFE
jgi:transcriptional regulator with XRE-family HTH domain